MTLNITDNPNRNPSGKPQYSAISGSANQTKKAPQMLTRLTRYVSSQFKQFRARTVAAGAAQLLALILLFFGTLAFVMFATALSDLGVRPDPFLSFVAFFNFSCMLLFVPLAFLLFCCSLGRAGPLRLVALSTVALLHVAGWHAFVGADFLQMTADTVWELRGRAYGLNCFSLGFPART